MSVADFEAIKTALHSGALTLTNAAQLTDAGTTISALTTTELGQLSGDNITSISATGDVTFSQAQITALGGGVTVTTTGHFILADTEANIEALTTATIDNDAAAWLNVIHATDVAYALNFTALQFSTSAGRPLRQQHHRHRDRHGRAYLEPELRPAQRHKYRGLHRYRRYVGRWTPGASASSIFTSTVSLTPNGNGGLNSRWDRGDARSAEPGGMGLYRLARHQRHREQHFPLS